MTPTQTRALDWFAEHEPVGVFGRGTPTKSMRKKLERDGLIERVPVAAGVHFRLTDAGRAARNRAITLNPEIFAAVSTYAVATGASLEVAANELLRSAVGA